MDNKAENPTPPEASSQPANPSRRKLGIAFGAMLAAFGLAKGASMASQTETGRRIIETAPGPDHSDRRPSLYTQQKKVQENLDAQDPTKRPSPVAEPTQQKIEADIKATLGTNPDNRHQTPTPIPKK